MMTQAHEHSLPSLHQAAEEGNLEVMKDLILHGKDYNKTIQWRGYSGSYTPLMIAAHSGHAAIVQYLVECGAKVNAVVEPPIVYAKHIETAKVLLDAGANIDAKNWDNLSVLDRAVMSQNKDLTAFLLSRGAKVRKYSLRLASYYPDVDIISLLFAANPENSNSHKDFMLCQVAQRGHLAAVEFLLAKGANINAVPLAGEMTILQCAAKGGNKALVEMLLEKGADSELPNRLDAPLVIAAGQLELEGHHEVVELLLELGANVNARNEYGETALMRAAPLAYYGVIDDNYELDQYKVFQTLLSHGATIDAEDYEKKDEYGTYLINPLVIPWLIHQYAWHKRRHAMCFYARIHHLTETAMSSSLSAK